MATGPDDETHRMGKDDLQRMVSGKSGPLKLARQGSLEAKPKEALAVDQSPDKVMVDLGEAEANNEDARKSRASRYARLDMPVRRTPSATPAPVPEERSRDRPRRAVVLAVVAVAAVAIAGALYIALTSFLTHPKQAQPTTTTESQPRIAEAPSAPSIAAPIIAPPPAVAQPLAAAPAAPPAAASKKTQRHKSAAWSPSPSKDQGLLDVSFLDGSKHRSCYVFVDGVGLGSVPLQRPIALGSHRLVVAAHNDGSGEVYVSRSIVAEPNGRNGIYVNIPDRKSEPAAPPPVHQPSEEASSAPPPPTRLRLKFGSGTGPHRDCYAIVDGANIGLVPQEYTVAPGHHVIECAMDSHGSGRYYQTTVEVDRNSTQVVIMPTYH
jgi:hypothetical protein